MSMFSFLSCASADNGNLDPNQFAEQVKDTSIVQLVDVRTAPEYVEGHIKGAVLIDVSSNDFLDRALASLDKEKPVAVYCRSGARSSFAAQMLRKQGYKVYNLSGGVGSWLRAGKALEK